MRAIPLLARRYRIFALVRNPACREKLRALGVLPETLLSFTNESRRLNNRRMKRELRVRLHYPVVADMLATIKHP